MIKNLFITAILILTAFTMKAQNGNISGKVINQQNTPLFNVNVTLQNTGKGTTTNTNGDFYLENVKPGSYKLLVSFLGYNSQAITITVKGNETLNIPTIKLKEGDEELTEVIINGHQTNKFRKEASVYVSKMPLKDIENPQVYTSISNKVMQDQVITSFDDALKNAPGIDRLWESTGRGNDGAGYFSLRGFAVQPTLINGLPGLTNGSPDPANIESIDVVKGPSGTLYGSSLISYGGLININTKKPFLGFGGNISYTGGSYGLNRVTADVNTLLSKEKDVAIRINTAYHTQNSFQDAGFKKSFFFAPSLLYKVNDRLSFNINTEFYNGKSTNQTMLFVDRGNPLTVKNIDELYYDHKRSYTSNDLYIDTPTYSLQGVMNYKISDSWTSQTVFSRANAKSEGYYSYLYEGTTTAKQAATALGISPISNGIILARSTSRQNSETIGTDIQQNFIGDFKIGNMRNRIVVGLDYFQKRLIDNSTGYGNQGFVYLGTDIDNFQAIAPALHANYGSPMGTLNADDTGILTQNAADAGIAASYQPDASRNETEQQIYSAYASNVINILPELSAMVSLRVDRFFNRNINDDSQDFNQTAFSPKFGIVYQPILDKVSVFANYMDGFSNVAPITTPGNLTYIFDPEHAKQFEFGTKINVFKNRLAATLSYYNIKVENTVLQLSPENYIQDGEQTNKGFEASIIANPIEGLNIIAGYSYNDSNLDNAEQGNDFLGRRPESAGPQNLANLWASYRFSNNALKGFGLGFGGNYASENKIFNRNVAGVFTLPEYTIFNASLFYDVEAFRITLKLDNIANKEYYKGWSTISPQNLRSVSANFTYNF